MIRLLSLLIYLYCTTLTHAQNLDLFGGGNRLRLQHILPDEKRLGNDEILNLRIPRYAQLTSISDNGMFFIIEKLLIKNEGESFKLVNYPFSDRQSSYNIISSNNSNALIFINYNENSTVTELHFFNIDNEEIDSTITLPSAPYLSLVNNSSHLLYTRSTDTQLFFHVVEHYDNNFQTEVAIEFKASDNLAIPRIMHFSKSGDRIFFNAKLRDTRETKIFIIDKIDSGWSKPYEWLPLDADGQHRIFGLVDYANNGRTLLVNHIDNGLSLTREINGNWTVPIPIGLNIPGTIAQISEDGKVIAAQVRKGISPFDFAFHDIVVLLQNSSGNWTQHQLNDPKLEVAANILFSKDGTKLYWLPANTSHIPNALEYK